MGEDGNPERAQTRSGGEKARAVSRPAGVYEVLRDWKLFDADEGEDLAAEIREYYIPDFSEWKNHDSYAREFEKLLRDLRTEESKST